MKQTFADDPTPTYRGYRRQALYCLYRIFDDGLSANTEIQPEGNEDLEIRSNSGNRLEVVQVKDYSAGLTASDFKPSFYRRIYDLCASDASVAIKIVSFGKIGPELRKAYDNFQVTPKRPLTTLTKDREEKTATGERKTIKGLSEEEASVVFKRLEIEIVDEAALTHDVKEKLTSTMTAGNPEVAFENLMWWLISSAEEQRRLTRAQTIEKLSELGKFIAHRNAHAQEWNVSIKQIESAPPDEQTREKLRNEFFQGGRVRAEHVAAGLDVRRDHAITSIHRAFQDNDVVILRGASGQGKTTLAYRYLLDWAPSDFRYQVEMAANLEHARLMAAAIAGHADILDVPSIIFIDVRPGDNWWVEIVRELAEVYGIRVLVTIREEDWFRSRVSTADFAFTDISVDFTKESGSQIFEELRNMGYGDNQLDFKDAWTKLGTRKTLFEFAYLITQNTQLSQRIKAQVGILKDEVNKGNLVDKELHLLRLVAVASAYEARLDLKALAEFVKLPEPARVLERFGNEYLLRTSADGKHVEGFHAIRSEILAEELTDPVLQPREIVLSFLPPLVVENDLESLLLCSFSRNQSAESRILKSLGEIQLNTWIGVRAVFVALQWLGIKRYSAENMKLIKEARSTSPSCWWFTLDWDLAQAKGRNGFDILQNLAETSKEFIPAAAVANTIQERQSNKHRIFDLSRKWLETFMLPVNSPDSVNQFTSAGEVLYWLGHLCEENRNVKEWLDEQTISNAWQILPLHLFARFAAGVCIFNSDIYMGWLEQHRNTVEKRIRSEAAIIAFVEEDDCLVAHFVIDLEQRSSELTTSEEEPSVNDLAVQRIEIVSNCLPGYLRYGATGYGHQMGLFESLGDDSIKRMALEHIPMPWLPEFNALARGAVEYEFRSNSWNKYFTCVRELRERVLFTFGNLRHVVAKDGDSKLLDIENWNECKKSIDGEFLLPKSAVDEWGFIAESHAKNSTGSLRKKFSAISTLEPFNEAFNEYSRSLGNFFVQAYHALLLVPNLNLAGTETMRRAVIEKGKEHGVLEKSIRLSVVNGMDACIALRKLQKSEHALLLEDRMEINEAFVTTELSEFLVTMQSWMLFCYPNQILPNKYISKRKTNKNTEAICTLIMRDGLQATANRISHELTKLKTGGTKAKIHSEDVKWNGELCLWISFDNAHPMGSLLAIEAIWKTLIEAFRPDRDKIVRIKIIDYLWSKIILVPLVQGRSLEGQAYANMNGVTNPFDEDPANQLWRFVPEEIPKSAWDQLGLSRWSLSKKIRVFDEFTAAYGTTFRHVDHLADLTRCKIDLDENGETVFLEYAKKATKRLEPFAQEAFDSGEALMRQLPEMTELVDKARPNLFEFISLIVQVANALHPSDEFNMKGGLTFDEIEDWRDKLKEGLNSLGLAKQLLLADTLGLPKFDYPEDNGD